METENLSPEIAAKIFEIRAGLEVDDNEVFAANKAALAHFMKKNKLNQVVVTYAGSGDNGGIDEVVFGYFKENVIDENQEIYLIERRWDSRKKQEGLEIIKLNPKDAFSYMTEEALRLTGHEGWELDDGGDGEVTFVLSEEGVVVRIEHNEYYTQVNRHEYEL